MAMATTNTTTVSPVQYELGIRSDPRRTARDEDHDPEDQHGPRSSELAPGEEPALTATPAAAPRHRVLQGLHEVFAARPGSPQQGDAPRPS